MVLLLMYLSVLTTRWTLTALALICSYNGGLLRSQAPVGNMGRALEDTTLIRPNQGCPSSTVDGDGDRVRQIAVAAGYRTEDAVGADPAHVHDIARGVGLAELRRG